MEAEEGEIVEAAEEVGEEATSVKEEMTVAHPGAMEGQRQVETAVQIDDEKPLQQ